MAVSDAAHTGDSILLQGVLNLMMDETKRLCGVIQTKVSLIYQGLETS
jgi:hypothetical protein